MLSSKSPRFERWFERWLEQPSPSYRVEAAAFAQGHSIKDLLLFHGRGPGCTVHCALRNPLKYKVQMTENGLYSGWRAAMCLRTEDVFMVVRSMCLGARGISMRVSRAQRGYRPSWVVRRHCWRITALLQEALVRSFWKTFSVLPCVRRGVGWGPHSWRNHIPPLVQPGSGFSELFSDADLMKYMHHLCQNSKVGTHNSSWQMGKVKLKTVSDSFILT